MKNKLLILMAIITFMFCIQKTYAFENKQIDDNQINSTINSLSSNKFAIIAANQSECDSLFGTMQQNGKNGQPLSIRYLMNEILTYVRIIVPILIIGLGSLDLAKAMVSGKEDEMRKAQKTFIMRVVAGVAVFFVPVIVNIVMWIADKVWYGLGYTTCRL